MTRWPLIVHLLLVPLIVGIILLVRGREPEQSLTQLWWIPALRAQQFLIAFCLAFASFPGRIVTCLCACIYVVAVFIIGNAILYDHVVQFDGPVSQRLMAIWEALAAPLICAILLLPFRWIIGTATRETGINPIAQFRIVDLLLSTLIIGLALTFHRAHIASIDEGTVSSLGLIEQLEEYKRIWPWTIVCSLDSLCVIGLTLGILSRSLWFTGSILLLSVITLNLSLIAYFPNLSSSSFLSMFGYQWGIVAATLIFLRLLGFRVGNRTITSRDT